MGRRQWPPKATRVDVHVVDVLVNACGAGGGSPAKDKVGVDDLAHSERERVLELLLSQERVVALLYERTFPPRTEEQAAAAAAIMEGADDEATEEDAEAIANM